MPRDTKNYVRDQLPDYFSENGDLGTITNSVGNPVYEADASLTVGKKGPILLEDWQLLDVLSRFARERIPERVVHAKGASAAGYFTCTADLSKYTSAKVFEYHKQTPIRVRFSTVAGNLGSADTVRDPRGFAIKFYTEDGIWDLVGNNTPIFFVRDPIMFPMFIHSQKRNPATNTRDWNAFWDFISLRPESTHQVMILMSDRGIPDGVRHMHGFGSHTFSLLNDAGKKTYCKFIYRTEQGIKNIPPARAEQLAGSQPDYAITDLYNAIARGDCPKWKFYLQLMTEEQSKEVTFDPFDVTKVWPHGQFPLKEVGEFVLNKNPDNYFAEVEQLSFSPASFVPGIGPSPDRMLLGRIFSYNDAHLHRLGPNYTQLPVNASISGVQNFLRDGLDVIDNQGAAPNYHPNSFGGPNSDATLRYAYPTETVRGETMRYDTRDEDNFTQPSVFWRRVLNAEQRQHMVDNIISGLRFAIRPIQERTVNLFANVDSEFGSKLTEGLKKYDKDLNISV